MPYICRDKRSQLDPWITELVQRIETQGELNYAITKLVFREIGDFNYASLEAAIGTLECAKQELYRRVVGPYEDVKCRENGEVYNAV